MKRAHVLGLLSQMKDRVSGEIDEELTAGELQALVATAAGLMLAAASGIGECRKALPYSTLQPVLDAHGLRWCCTHPSQHCS